MRHFVSRTWGANRDSPIAAGEPVSLIANSRQNGTAALILDLVTAFLQSRLGSPRPWIVCKAQE